jgi:hypothetical protein
MEENFIVISSVCVAKCTIYIGCSSRIDIGFITLFGQYDSSPLSEIDPVFYVLFVFRIELISFNLGNEILFNGTTQLCF